MFGTISKMVNLHFGTVVLGLSCTAVWAQIDSLETAAALEPVGSSVWAPVGNSLWVPK